MGDHDAQNRLGCSTAPRPIRRPPTTPGCCPRRSSSRSSTSLTTRGRSCSAIGTTDLGTGSWAYAKVTQHTQVDVQSAEKAELASRKMLITKTSHHGTDLRRLRQRLETGHLRRQPADHRHGHRRFGRGSTPIETEQAAVADLLAGATAGTGARRHPDQAEVATALWGAAATAYTQRAWRRPTDPRRAPDRLRSVRAVVRSGQPAERHLDRVQRRRVRVRGDGFDLGHHRS